VRTDGGGGNGRGDWRGVGEAETNISRTSIDPTFTRNLGENKENNNNKRN